MTKSTILSNEVIAEILFNFLIGKLSFLTLKRKLKDLITFDFRYAPERREIYDLKIDENIQFTVKEEYLCEMLKKYISGEISDIDLSNWAAIIFMTPFFIPVGNTEEERWLSGEGPLWEILQKLVTPRVYGGLNFDIAKVYLSKLSSE